MPVSDPETVLLLAPYGRDSELLRQALSRAGMACAACNSVVSLSESLKAGAGVAIVADEALNRENVPILAQALREEPEWSDFPLLLMTGGGETTEASRFRLQLFEPLGNVTLIERPLRTVTLLSAVNTALRSRRHQYRIRDQLEQARRSAAILRSNEEKLTFAFEAAQLGSWELDLDSRTLYSSDQCGRNFGLQNGQELTYDRFWELVHPDDRAHIREEIDKALSLKQVYRAEYRVLPPDGSQRWIHATGRPILGSDGQARRLTGVTLDITERRKGEEAIRESEAQLQALADSMPQLAWMTNKDGYTFWYNRRWYDYTGTTLEQMRGWGWQCVHDPQWLPEVVRRWNASIATGEPFEMDFPLRGADGAFRWFLTRAQPVRNALGEIVRWLGTNTNIDDKRAAEKALRESEELARSVIHGSPDCVEVLDGEGRTVLVNAEGCRLLGLEDDASLLHRRWLDLWTGADRLEASKSFALAKAGRQAHFQGSSRSSSNGLRWWDVIISPIARSDGKVSKLICVSRDITAQRQADEQLRQTAKLESLGVMAGGIAHDFNNLLTGILGNASLLVESVAGPDRSVAEDIVLAAERAAELTKQMLAYSGRGRFEVTRVDLSTRVRETLRLIQPSIDKKVEVLLDLNPEPCLIEGDASQMQQVIMNLVINAGEAFEGKAGQVRVSTGRMAVGHDVADDLRSYDVLPGDYVYLSVQDSGKGMDEETKAKIFDPFFSTKFTGRGLGLAAVSGIVRGHKGALLVHSAPGVGTTFKVLFPAVHGEQIVHSSSPPAPVTRGGGVVLLVDDEEVVQRMGANALQRHGYEIRAAANGRDAVNIFAEMHEQIVLVVLDMIMPVMGGEEALRRMRDIRPDIEVIVCSGYNEVEVIRRFTTQKIAAFLQKPYTARTLLQKVQEVLESKQQRKVSRP